MSDLSLQEWPVQSIWAIPLTSEREHPAVQIELVGFQKAFLRVWLSEPPTMDFVWSLPIDAEEVTLHE